MVQEALLELTSDIISAHVSNNSVSADDLPNLINAVYGSLSTLGQPEVPVEQERQPAVSIRSSVKSDAITCLECGARFKTLKRHLAADHGLTPDDYRARWNLASSYPLTAPDYSEKRKAMATETGLGKTRGGKRKAAHAEIKSLPAPDVAVSEEVALATPKGRRKLGIKAG